MLLLIQGMQETEMIVIDEKLPMQQQTFKMVSEKACCLLTDSPTAVQLVAICDWKKSLAYRLDEEMALVLVSAVERHGPRSASPGSNGANASTKRVSSSELEYWTQPVSKLRRMESEPK